MSMILFLTRKSAVKHTKLHPTSRTDVTSSHIEGLVKTPSCFHLTGNTQAIKKHDRKNSCWHA